MRQPEELVASPSSFNVEAIVSNTNDKSEIGHVYLLKAGPYYKIGKANSIDRRIRQVQLQLPYPVELIHTIATDDPIGIELYWHKRFTDKRTNGEWFLLTESDVTIFTSKSFM